MVISVATPRRSIRDAVLGGVLGAGGRQLYQPLRCAFYDGAAGGGLTAALSEDGAEGGVPLPCGRKTAAAKNVLILMSDTGGGHRASAEALRDAFRLEFGDAYQVGRSVRSMPAVPCAPSLGPLLPAPKLQPPPNSICSPKHLNSQSHELFVNWFDESLDFSRKKN